MKLKRLPLLLLAPLLLFLSTCMTPAYAQERVYAADGTVGAPGITFQNNAATGLYRTQVGGALGIANNGVAGITMTTTGATAAPVSLAIGPTGTAIVKLAKYSASLTPSAVSANTCAEQTFTVTGLATGDVVFVNKPTAQAGLGLAGARVSATDTLALNFCNNSGSPITPTAGQTYIIGALQ